MQECQRSYLLAKAHYLSHIGDDDDLRQTQPLPLVWRLVSCLPAIITPSTSNTIGHLKRRVLNGKTLPRVEVVGRRGGGVVGGNRSSKEVEEDLLVVAVLEHVICGGLKGEMFVELMEVMGMTTGGV